MVNPNPPFDEQDPQATWSLIWLVIGGLAAIGLFLFDLIAAERSIFYTLSYNGGYGGVRHPWAVLVIEGILGHMLLQRNAEPILQITPYASLNFALVCAALILVWEGLRYFTALEGLHLWPMYALMAVSPLIGAWIWPLRPTLP